MHSSTAPPPQSATGVAAHHMTTPGEWSTGLCDCTKDMSSCCMTCWCPCVTFGRIAEVVDKGATSCSVSGFIYLAKSISSSSQWIYSAKYRSKLRQQYTLTEKPCNDCLVHCFCEGCALCQEYRELKYRGLDPSLGWQGNLARQSKGVVMPPVGPGEMKR